MGTIFDIGGFVYFYKLCFILKPHTGTRNLILEKAKLSYVHDILQISTLLIVLLLSEYVHLIFLLCLPSLHYCGFCFQLFSGFDASEAYVVVLNTLPTHRFTSEVPTSDLPVPILRGLKTSKFAGTPMCPVLEQPNLVSGLAAQG